MPTILWSRATTNCREANTPGVVGEDVGEDMRIGGRARWVIYTSKGYLTLISHTTKPVDLQYLVVVIEVGVQPDENLRCGGNGRT